MWQAEGCSCTDAQGFKELYRKRENKHLTEVLEKVDGQGTE
jgi:hypothetical protein